MGAARLAEGDDGVLGREDIGVAEPADEPPVLDPRPARDDGLLAAEPLEQVDQRAEGLRGGGELGRSPDQFFRAARPSPCRRSASRRPGPGPQHVCRHVLEPGPDQLDAHGPYPGPNRSGDPLPRPKPSPPDRTRPARRQPRSRSIGPSPRRSRPSVPSPPAHVTPPPRSRPNRPTAPRPPPHPPRVPPTDWTSAAGRRRLRTPHRLARHHPERPLVAPHIRMILLRLGAVRFVNLLHRGIRASPRIVRESSDKNE